MGVTILFNGNVAEYPTVLTRYQGTERMGNSPNVYAYQKKNIAVTGPGILDASGVPAFSQRSNFFEPYRCQNVYVQGITLQHTKFWQFHPTLSTNMLVDGVTTINDGTGNNDAFDPEAMTDLVIENSTLQSRDDSIAIKSGRDAQGRMDMIPTSNFVFMHMKMTSSNWGMMTLGSELSGGIHDVYAYDIDVIPPGVNHVFEIKGNTLRGGTVTDVHMDNVRAMGGLVHGSVMWADMYYMSQSGTFMPMYSNFSLSHAMISGAPDVLNLAGVSANSITQWVSNITMSDSTYTTIGSATNNPAGVNVTWTNVTINGAPAH
jgi:polygalacturonase